MALASMGSSLGYGILGLMGVPVVLEYIEQKFYKLSLKQALALTTVGGQALLALANARSATALKISNAFSTSVLTSVAVATGKRPWPSTETQSNQMTNAALTAIAAGFLLEGLLTQVSDHPHRELLISQIFSAVIASILKP